jgi:hypothetical protein
MSLTRDQLAAALHAVEEIGVNSILHKEWYASAADGLRAEIAALPREYVDLPPRVDPGREPRTYLCWVNGDPWEQRIPVTFVGEPSIGDVVRITGAPPKLTPNLLPRQGVPGPERDIVALIKRRIWEQASNTVGVHYLISSLELDVDELTLTP